MPTKIRRDVDMLAMAAAHLLSQGKLQREIAEILKISQPDVHRLIKHAKDDKRGWLIIDAHFLGPQKAPELWQNTQDRYFASADLLGLLRQFEPNGTPCLKKVWIFQGEAEDRFDSTVLPAIQNIFAQASVIGVTWGRTVANLVVFLKQHAVQFPARADQAPLQFVPLCGEPIKHQEKEIERSSTGLAIGLNEIVNGKNGKVPPMLRGIPAFIPNKYKPEECKIIRRFIAESAGYNQIFGAGGPLSGNPAEPLVNKLDTIITSVGVANGKYRGIFLRERIENRDLTEQEMIETVVGDVGGIMITRRNLKKGQQQKITQLNDRWTGITLDFLKGFAQQAAQKGRPGVVVLANQKNRRDMVIRCIELGLINHLLVSRELSQELERVALANQSCSDLQLS